MDQNIIDCYKLEIIRDIPQELSVITHNRDSLFRENQKLKNIVWGLSISLGCVLVYNLINTIYAKKEKEQLQNHRN